MFDAEILFLIGLNLNQIPDIRAGNLKIKRELIEDNGTLTRLYAAALP
ncbi:hypothetical protein [Noviherbaspirillum malthae]|nr:hypothetical protein [Noviherbaspirillum malthae]